MKVKTKSATPRRTGSGKTAARVRFSAKGREQLFVYGTLKRGGKFHRELAKDGDVEFIGDARVRGERYRLRNSDYPGAIPTSNLNRYVHGQLFLLKSPKRILAAMDDFEEVDEGLFRRELVEVWTSKGRTKAWV